MDLIVPCAGRSSRYPGKLPKYMWPVGNQRMIEAVIDPFFPDSERVLIAILKEHDEKWGVAEILQAAGHEVLIIDEVTDGQAYTVESIIDHFDVDGPFFVKDSDSHFLCNEEWAGFGQNYVSCCNVRDYPHLTDLDAKSYLHINDQGIIVGVVEKQVVSNDFGCGGYAFDDPIEFKDGLSDCGGSQEVYLAHVIECMMKQGTVFFPMHCKEYRDYGTFDSWEWAVHHTGDMS